MPRIPEYIGHVTQGITILEDGNVVGQQECLVGTAPGKELLRPIQEEPGVIPLHA
jgi:hypothetical protein